MTCPNTYPKEPTGCRHEVTHRISGTRDLWHCHQCGGVLVDNVKLLEGSHVS